MQRDLLLLGEMIDAAEQIQRLAAGITVDELDERRERRDALLWNYTVLGEAAGQVSEETKARFLPCRGNSPCACATGSNTGTGRSTWKSFSRQPGASCPSSSTTFAKWR